MSKVPELVSAEARIEARIKARLAGRRVHTSQYLVHFFLLLIHRDTTSALKTLEYWLFSFHLTHCNLKPVLLDLATWKEGRAGSHISQNNSKK